MFSASRPRACEGASPKKRKTAATPIATDKARRYDARQGNKHVQGVRLDDLPREVVWTIATHAGAAGVIAMSLVNRHMVASVDGALRTTAIDQHTLLRRLRLFVMCMSHAVAAGHVSAVRLVRPFVVDDLEPRECITAIATGRSVHWIWLTIRGESIRYGEWHCAHDLGHSDAHLLALYRHMTTDGIECIVTSDKESPSGSATERALWTAVVGYYPPPRFNKRLQKQKSLGSCDRIAPAADAWARWSADPAAAEAFVREAALCPLPKETTDK